MPYAVTHVETLHAGWTKLLRATVRFPDGRLVRREIEDHGAAVGVLPYDPDRRMAMLISQVRTPPLHAAGEATVLFTVGTTPDREHVWVAVAAPGAPFGTPTTLLA